MNIHPPQKTCDRCGMPDFLAGYTHSRIPQVTRVFFGAEYYHYSGIGSIPGPDKVGIDLGDLCQDCRIQVYEWFIENFPKKYSDSTGKEYPSRLDDHSPHFSKNDKPCLPWWKDEIIIRNVEGKVLKNGVFVKV